MIQSPFYVSFVFLRFNSFEVLKLLSELSIFHVIGHAQFSGDTTQWRSSSDTKHTPALHCFRW